MRSIFGSFILEREKTLYKQQKICAIYGEDAIDESAVRKWFVRFRREDRKRAGLPEVVDDQIEVMIKNNPGHTTLDIADLLHISHMSVVRPLEYMNRYSSEVLQDLIDDISICDSNATKGPI